MRLCYLALCFGKFVGLLLTATILLCNSSCMVARSMILLPLFLGALFAASQLGACEGNYTSGSGDFDSGSGDFDSGSGDFDSGSGNTESGNGSTSGRRDDAGSGNFSSIGSLGSGGSGSAASGLGDLDSESSSENVTFGSGNGSESFNPGEFIRIIILNVNCVCCVCVLRRVSSLVLE